jgi:hypothetical protein
MFDFPPLDLVHRPAGVAVTAPAPLPGGGSSGLLGRLMAEVRGEFRSDVLEFAPEDPVFGGTACRVAGCGRTARGRGLCQGHLQRWNNQGRPDLQRFVGSTDPRSPPPPGSSIQVCEGP